MCRAPTGSRERSNLLIHNPSLLSTVIPLSPHNAPAIRLRQPHGEFVFAGGVVQAPRQSGHQACYAGKCRRSTEGARVDPDARHHEELPIFTILFRCDAARRTADGPVPLLRRKSQVAWAGSCQRSHSRSGRARFAHSGSSGHGFAAQREPRRAPALLSGSRVEMVSGFDVPGIVPSHGLMTRHTPLPSTGSPGAEFLRFWVSMESLRLRSSPVLCVESGRRKLLVSSPHGRLGRTKGVFALGAYLAIRLSRLPPAPFRNGSAPCSRAQRSCRQRGQGGQDERGGGR